MTIEIEVPDDAIDAGAAVIAGLDGETDAEAAALVIEAVVPFLGPVIANAALQMQLAALCNGRTDDYGSTVVDRISANIKGVDTSAWSVAAAE